MDSDLIIVQVLTLISHIWCYISTFKPFNNLEPFKYHLYFLKKTEQTFSLH